MKKFSTLALAATLVGTMSISALTPVAYAQDNTNNKKAEQKHERKGKGQFRAVRGGHAFLGGMCSTQGAEKLEKKLDIMAIRIDLTDAQRPAFEDLKTAALTAQSDFAQSCAPLKEQKPEGTAERLKHRSAMMELQLESMNVVLPAFEAFYNGLTDEQKSQLDKVSGKKGPKGKRGKFGKSPKGEGERGKGPRGLQGAANSTSSNG